MKSPWRKSATVTFHRSDMLIAPIFTVFGVSLTAARAIFFIRKKHASNAVFRLNAECLKNSEHFQSLNNACTIVVGTFTYIPTIEMATYRYDMIGKDAAGNLCYHIMRQYVRIKFAI